MTEWIDPFSGLIECPNCVPSKTLQPLLVLDPNRRRSRQTGREQRRQGEVGDRSERERHLSGGGHHPYVGDRRVRVGGVVVPSLKKLSLERLSLPESTRTSSIHRRGAPLGVTVPLLCDSIRSGPVWERGSRRPVLNSCLFSLSL